MELTEFTEREKQLILLMKFLMDPNTAKVPLDLRLISMAMIFKIQNIPYDEQFLKDMSRAIEDHLNLAIKESYGFLNKHPEIMEHVKNINLKDF